MAQRISTLRLVPLMACLAVMSVLGGCGAATDLTITNVSDAWLNVRVFVGDLQTDPENPSSFASDFNLQVEPGSFTSCRLPGNLQVEGDHATQVHVQVEPVRPSWESGGDEYWLKLMAQPPIVLVASGRADKLRFDTGVGAVALVPTRDIRRQLSEQRVTGVTETAE